MEVIQPLASAHCYYLLKREKKVAARLYVASCDSMGVAKGDHGINPLSYTKNGEKQKKSSLVIALRSSDIRIISKISFEHIHPE